MSTRLGPAIGLTVALFACGNGTASPSATTRPADTATATTTPPMAVADMTTTEVSATTDNDHDDDSARSTSAVTTAMESTVDGDATATVESPTTVEPTTTVAPTATVAPSTAPPATITAATAPPVDLAGAPLVRDDPATPVDALRAELDRVAAAIFAGDDSLGVAPALRISPTGLAAATPLRAVPDLEGDACTDFIIVRDGLPRYNCILTDGATEARVGFVLDEASGTVTVAFAGGRQPGFKVTDEQRAAGKALITEIMTAWFAGRLDDVADRLPPQTLDILRNEPAPRDGELEIVPDCPSPDLVYGAGTDAECGFFVSGTPSATVIADMRLTADGWQILLIDPFVS